MFSETNETINISGEGLVTPTAKPESMPGERSYNYIQNLKEDDIQLMRTSTIPLTRKHG
jgi:hypothetical protein